jgi:serine/threonine protein kinase
MPRQNEQIGPYTLISQLGRGAFGTVWLAERRGALATTKVALKLIMDDDPDLNAISQESQVWAQVAGHPNILSIIEADMYDGQVVIVSEYAPDGSLEGWLKRNGGKAPSIDSAVAMMSGILSGLEHLHSKQIIHRDLKPANILLQGETPRLADFGLARVLRSSANSGGIAGTPVYMSPEAFDGKRSEQSDIWSAGVIFYQMLAGRTPYPQSDLTALIGAIVQREPDSLPASIPAALQEVVSRALQKETSKRFQSVAELKAALLGNPIRATNQIYSGTLTKPEVEARPTAFGIGQASISAPTAVQIDTEASTKEIPPTNTTPASGQRTVPDTVIQTVTPPSRLNWKLYAGSALVLIVLSMSFTLYITDKRGAFPPPAQPAVKPAVQPAPEESRKPEVVEEKSDPDPEVDEPPVAKVPKAPLAGEKQAKEVLPGDPEFTPGIVEPPIRPGLSPEEIQRLRNMRRMIQRQAAARRLEAERIERESRRNRFQQNRYTRTPQ